MMVTNSYGIEIDYDVAVELMDDYIRETLHNDISPCTEQEFFAAYCNAHYAAYGEAWALDDPHPCY